MSRLVLICAPVTSIACGLWCGFVLDHILQPFWLLLGKKGYTAPDQVAEEELQEKAPVKDAAKDAKAKGKAKEKEAKAPKKKARPAPKRPVELNEWEEELRPGGMGELKRYLADSQKLPAEQMAQYTAWRVYLDNDRQALLGRAAVSVLLVVFVYLSGSVAGKVTTFVSHCDQVARSLSNPQVVFSHVDRRTGQRQIIDDYLKGYQWIDQNTPKDSRVMAWWDYGYQITGIAKRASIADGNTWNHEHIATLGRTLTSPEKKAWNTIRHLADYVLVWAGGGGDDLGKSPHLARIGNSVFPDHCGDDDPKCNKFSFYSDHSPTPMMAKSLLYKLCQHKVSPGVRVNENLFKEVHTTQHGLMRVYQVMNISQESKDWIADPANRVCDAPGSWYCVGQYPPAIHKLIEKRRSFSQVEDFNKAGDKSAYTKLIEKEKRGEL